MARFFDINLFALFGQLLIRLINGSFYALLALGLALVGLVYGKLAVRREGIYFAMATLALAQLASLTDVHRFMQKVIRKNSG
tara:strand:- start:52 stop:297 length:246 start_codon:yes stop_codon:yes gene_type:complete